MRYHLVRDLFYRHTGIDWWLENIVPYHKRCICIACAKQVLPPQLWITP